MTGTVLALDTATVVSVGLARDGEIIGRAQVADRMAHVEQLMPLVRRCLADAQVAPAELTAIVVGLGPGPFTGLRVGVATAQVLALAWGLPWRGVCSLDVLARQHQARTEFIVATDARRREVYWAHYDASGTRLAGPSVTAPDDVPRLPTIGPAADLYADRLLVSDGPRTLDAGVLAASGPSLPDAGRQPLYLRRPDAVEPTRRKSVLHYRRDAR